MGNRAIIVFTNRDCTNYSPLVYLHWNGGPESVYQFLDELDRRDIRADQDYKCARFISIVGQYFDSTYYGTTSLGVSNGPKNIGEVSQLSDQYGLDNGVYLVCRENDARSVRRWLTEKELPKAEVKKELTIARKHDYAQDGGFMSVFGNKLTEKQHFDTERRARA